jgi:hypothetical protein
VGAEPEFVNFLEVQESIPGLIDSVRFGLWRGNIFPLTINLFPADSDILFKDDVTVIRLLFALINTNENNPPQKVGFHEDQWVTGLLTRNSRVLTNRLWSDTGGRSEACCVTTALQLDITPD